MRGVVIAALLAAACGEKTDPVKFRPPLVCAAGDLYCPVKQVFVQSCALSGCHVPGGDAPMSLAADDAYDSIVNVETVAYCREGLPANPGIRVRPGDPDSSCVIRLLTDDPVTPTMPALGGPLDPAAIQLIHDWILAGAPR